METTKQYIKNVIKTAFPALDLSEGSPLSELFVNPTSAIFDPVLTQLKYLLDNMGIKDPESIHPDELDAIASNFLIYRNLGVSSSGYVELFYETAQNLLIPAGTQFLTADGTVFQTTSAIQVSRETMALNSWRFPLYSTGLIPVTAQLTSTTAIPPEAIVETNLVPAPVLVTNTTGFSENTAAETNTELAERMIRAVLNKSLASATSIESLLMEKFPSIRSTVVLGPEDDRMIRDLYHSGMSAQENYVAVDFRGKISIVDFYTSSGGNVYVRASGIFDSTANFDEYPYAQSKAYWTLFYDDPTTSGLTQDLPSPDEFLLEFNTAQYASLYYLDDVLKTTLQTTLLLEDPFTSGALDPRWITGDAHFGYNALASPEEIKTTVNGIRLGHTPDASALLSSPLTINRDFMKRIKDAIGLALTMSPQVLKYYNPDALTNDIKFEMDRAE